MRVLGGRRGVGAVREGRVSDVVRRRGETRRRRGEERKGDGDARNETTQDQRVERREAQR